MKKHTEEDRGFTLIELLSAIAVIAILGAIMVPSLQKVRAQALQSKCAATLRSLGSATLLYTNEHKGEFPRSWHSAGTHREPGWAVSIAPYLGISKHEINQNWEDAFNRLYRSPVTEETDALIFSYALNVHFELTRDEDYVGSPRTWRKVSQIEAPSQTILMAQTRPVRFGDHFMAHMWSGLSAAQHAVLHDAHKGQAHYLFVDGSVALHPLEFTFNPAQKRNLWNPSLAGIASR